MYVIDTKTLFGLNRQIILNMSKDTNRRWRIWFFRAFVHFRYRNKLLISVLNFRIDFIRVERTCSSNTESDLTVTIETIP